MDLSKKTGNSIEELQVWRFQGKQMEQVPDQLTVEVPTALLIEYGPINSRKRSRISVNLLTPENAEVWAIGFLFCEGLIGSMGDVETIEYGQDEIIVKLASNPEAWQHLQFDRTARKLAATASCGFCGKENLDGLSWEPAYFPRQGFPKIAPELLVSLTEKLNSHQKVFSKTGSLHAAALFSTAGELLGIKEDIGRHNALDKLIGEAIKANLLPLRDHILWLSGRIGFELVQKASMAGIPIVAAVGAPSTMAVKAAEITGITLAGFLRNGKFNCYTLPERLMS